jgi:hypothetical protein
VVSDADLTLTRWKPGIHGTSTQPAKGTIPFPFFWRDTTV